MVRRHGEMLPKAECMHTPTIVEQRNAQFVKACQHDPQELFLPMSSGSDVTVQISSADDRLTVQLPFGSHTRTFLQEVSRCSPGTSSMRADVTVRVRVWRSRCCVCSSLLHVEEQR